MPYARTRQLRRLSEINPKEKEINSLTQTAFYSIELMARQAWRMEYEFEKECISQMARSTLREHQGAFAGDQASSQKYTVAIKIGHGVTYTKYNTLMHFLNVAQCYWQNPDLNAIQVFGYDRHQLPSARASWSLHPLCCPHARVHHASASTATCFPPPSFLTRFARVPCLCTSYVTGNLSYLVAGRAART